MSIKVINVPTEIAVCDICGKEDVDDVCALCGKDICNTDPCTGEGCEDGNLCAPCSVDHRFDFVYEDQLQAGVGIVNKHTGQSVVGKWL